MFNGAAAYAQSPPQGNLADSDTAQAPLTADLPFFTPPTRLTPPDIPQPKPKRHFLLAVGARLRSVTLPEAGANGVSGFAFEPHVYLGGRGAGGLIGFSSLEGNPGFFLGGSFLRFGEGIAVYSRGATKISVLMPDINMEAQVYFPDEPVAGGMISTNGFGARFSHCLGAISLHASVRGPVFGVGMLLTDKGGFRADDDPLGYHTLGTVIDVGFML